MSDLPKHGSGNPPENPQANSVPMHTFQQLEHRQSSCNKRQVRSALLPRPKPAHAPPGTGTRGQSGDQHRQDLLRGVILLPHIQLRQFQRALAMKYFMQGNWCDNELVFPSFLSFLLLFPPFVFLPHVFQFILCPVGFGYKVAHPRASCRDG